MVTSTVWLKSVRKWVRNTPSSYFLIFALFICVEFSYSFLRTRIMYCVVQCCSRHPCQCIWFLCAYPACACRIFPTHFRFPLTPSTTFLLPRVLSLYRNGKQITEKKNNIRIPTCVFHISYCIRSFVVSLPFLPFVHLFSIFLVINETNGCHDQFGNHLLVPKILISKWNYVLERLCDCFLFSLISVTRLTRRLMSWLFTRSASSDLFWKGFSCVHRLTLYILSPHPNTHRHFSSHCIFTHVGGLRMIRWTAITLVNHGLVRTIGLWNRLKKGLSPWFRGSGCPIR